MLPMFARHFVRHFANRMSINQTVGLVTVGHTTNGSSTDQICSLGDHRCPKSGILAQIVSFTQPAIANQPFWLIFSVASNGRMIKIWRSNIDEVHFINLINLSNPSFRMWNDFTEIAPQNVSELVRIWFILNLFAEWPRLSNPKRLQWIPLHSLNRRSFADFSFCLMLANWSNWELLHKTRILR